MQCHIKIHHQSEPMSAMWKPKFYWLKITPQLDNLGLPDMWKEKHYFIWVIIIILIVFYLFVFVLNFCCSLKQDRRTVKTNMKWSIWVEQLHSRWKPPPKQEVWFAAWPCLVRAGGKVWSKMRKEVQLYICNIVCYSFRLFLSVIFNINFTAFYFLKKETKLFNKHVLKRTNSTLI